MTNHNDPVSLTPEELDLILAGLRCFQEALMDDEVPEAIMEIATEHGRRFIEEPTEIDALCEHLNCSDDIKVH